MMDINGVYCGTDVVRDMTFAKITLQHIPSAAAVVCLNGATVAVAVAQCTTADALEVVIQQCQPPTYTSLKFTALLSYVFVLLTKI